MAELVTGTGSIVGFAHGEHGHHGHHHNPGINDKDASFLSSNHTQDRVHGAAHGAHMDAAFNQAHTDRFGYAILKEVSDNGRDNLVAIEKNGLSSLLATEKIGAAGQLATEKTAAASQLATEKAFAAIQLEACRNNAAVLAAIAACCCKTQEGQAEIKALTLSIDANRIRDDLAQCRAELLARQTFVPGSVLN